MFSSLDTFQITVLAISGSAILIVLIIFVIRLIEASRQNIEKDTRDFDANTNYRSTQEPVKPSIPKTRYTAPNQSVTNSIPEPNYPPTNKSLVAETSFIIQHKFAALRFLSGLIKFFAILIGVTGCVYSVVVITGSVNSFGTNLIIKGSSLASGLFGIVVFTVIGILIYAYGDFIQCIIDIEQNTRQTAINTSRNKNN